MNARTSLRQYVCIYTKISWECGCLWQSSSGGFPVSVTAHSLLLCCRVRRNAFKWTKFKGEKLEPSSVDVLERRRDRMRNGEIGALCHTCARKHTESSFPAVVKKGRKQIKPFLIRRGEKPVARTVWRWRPSLSCRSNLCPQAVH